MLSQNPVTGKGLGLVTCDCTKVQIEAVSRIRFPLPGIAGVFAHDRLDGAPSAS